MLKKLPGAGALGGNSNKAGEHRVKLKLFISFLLLAALSSGAAFSAELKPYQKEALKKLEEAYGAAVWPMVRKQYETTISQASEKEVKTIVEMTVKSQGNTSPDGESASVEAGDAGGADDYEITLATREDLEKQIDPTHESFIEFVANVGVERGLIGDQARREIYKAEKGARLQAVAEVVTQSKFVTHKSLGDGIEQVRVARAKLIESKKFYKVNMPSGSPPDTTAAVKTIILSAAERIKDLNVRYGKIAADIKKRIDAIPYGGGVDIDKALKALLDEREKHNKALSAEVVAIVDEMNGRIAEEDRKIFEWILKPLREAQPQAGPVATR
jgi:hypothetical protein